MKNPQASTGEPNLPTTWHKIEDSPCGEAFGFFMQENDENSRELYQSSQGTWINQVPALSEPFECRSIDTITNISEVQ